jgi:hypothetical protein
MTGSKLFDLSEVDYQQYNVEFMMVDYKRDSQKDIYGYMYETEKTQWLNRCPHKGQPNGEWLENTLAISQFSPLNDNLSRLTASFIYGQHVQILCHVASHELDDNERMGIRLAKCYVILNDTKGNSKKQIKKKLKDLQKNIVPYGKNILEGKYDLNIKWKDSNDIIYGNELFQEIDYIRFIVCTREHYFQKTMTMMDKGPNFLLFKDFCRSHGRRSCKQRVTDVTRNSVSFWNTPMIDFILTFPRFHFQVQFGWPFRNIVNYYRFEEHDDLI